MMDDDNDLTMPPIRNRTDDDDDDDSTISDDSNTDDDLSGTEMDSDSESNSMCSDYTHDSFEFYEQEEEQSEEEEIELEEDELDDLINDTATVSPSKRPRGGWQNLNPIRMNLDDQFIATMEVETASTENSLPTQSSQPSSRPMGSILHDHHVNKKIIWVSFDIETGGPKCGILQLSAVFYNHDGILLGQFNEYVKPPSNAIFLPQACECHGMTHRNDRRLQGADNIEEVWNDFCKVVKIVFSTGVENDCVGVLVAWNGKSCDMEWIYRVITATNRCIMPPQINHFMDPMRVIKKYPGCALHLDKSKLPDLRLSTVYKFVTNSPLENAHNSLVDCLAQGDIIMSKQFKKYLDMKESICTIESV